MLGFIIAVAAGFLTPQIEGIVAAPVMKALRGHILIADTEKRLVAFIVAMLVAGIASAIFYSGTAFWMILGGTLGYFGTRIVAAIKKLIDDRNAAK